MLIVSAKTIDKRCSKVYLKGRTGRVEVTVMVKLLGCSVFISREGVPWVKQINLELGSMLGTTML